MENNNINTDTILIKKVWLIDKYNFYEYISVMLDWWVWVTESLESVNSKINSPYFKSKIRELITYISSWDSFSKSMKKRFILYINRPVNCFWANNWSERVIPLLP